MNDRIANAKLFSKVMTAAEAAEFIHHGDKVGISGFTGAGYPKELPTAIANRARAAHERGDEFQIDLFSGASTAPDCDGVLAEAKALRFRAPYQSDPTLRASINRGETLYADYHLSESGMFVEQGFFGKLTVAIVEAVRITEEGYIVPSSSIGNSVEYLDNAEKIIIEVNQWQSLELEGMADIYRIAPLPQRQPIPLTAPEQRIGQPYISIDPDKVVAVVLTHHADRNAPFKAIDAASQRMAGHFLEFLEGEVTAGRLRYDSYIMQSGVGNVPNAVTAGLLHSKFENIKAYTEVIQDGMLDLIDAGKMTVASATAFSLSPEYAEKMNREAARYRRSIVLRPQQISNHPEVVRRMGIIASNGLIEADIYGNVNSTHVTGSRMMNGIGGSGDFTRNSYISTFISPSEAKGGAISAIVPFVSHVDHTEQDVKVLITEYGYADLRGLAPTQRVPKIIAIAHPDYRPLLEEYYQRALAAAQRAGTLHTPHDLATAFAFHQRLQETGTMQRP
ncbi:acetyl-CoA hydrolase/transferase family protein [Corynebacterium sp. HS2168-gen11]|uniref:acetyl-CoA hydrolase/transferase family protein n=1 Tax=Corynebacterium sp. HS2168-gen11 TaxID=2974027 RepID=UPI00216B1E24|nr:acetyl-CoA hydrolase/transferase family protein [Corynebacterium sp. HS2168-gen11]MCS4536050.1 acetyl-CoA hydrolase/transferase family protein [Corynebacterium sp. HS2168-gen11]